VDNKIHLVGWREKFGDKVAQTIAFVFERRNNKGAEVWPIVHLAGKFDRNIHPRFYPTKLREEEAFEGEKWYSTQKIYDDPDKPESFKTITVEHTKQTDKYHD